MAFLLPLFPLDLVLLPGISLPLHIFEPRYQEMIGECLRDHLLFGIVRARDEGIADVGCAAEIVELLKRYDDGRMDIATVGRRRFEVLEINRERSFLRGQVTFFDDEEESEAAAEQASKPAEPAAEETKNARERALQLFAEIAEVIGSKNEVDPDSALLSYQLAGLLPIDLDFKQAMLAIRSERKRLARLIELFEAILPKLRKAERRREKAGGNGHVP